MLVLRSSGRIRASTSWQFCECVHNCSTSVLRRYSSRKPTLTSIRTERDEKDKRAPRLPRGDPFTRWLGERRREARNSLLVQVESGACIESVWSGKSPCIPDLKNFEPKKHLFKLDSNCFLLDLQNEKLVETVLSGLCYDDRKDFVLPVRTRMLHLRSFDNVSSPSLPSTSRGLAATKTTPKPLNKQLQETPNLDQQIRLLHALTRMTERGRRIRFFLASLLEEVLKGLFPENRMIPFGSSVTGFGDDQSDVDLCWSLSFHMHSIQENALELTCKSANDLVAGTPLAGLALDLDRVRTQKALETLSDVLERFVPGVQGMNRILNARVPIISFAHSITGAKCDISGDLRSSIDMTRLLWLTTQGAQDDERVAQLVAAVRFWAKQVDLHHAGFGRCVSNFMLTMLVIFFLQQNSLTPSFKQISEDADPLSTMAAQSASCRQTVGMLLPQFFTFYARFDFAHKGVCLWTGTAVDKPFPVPLYIRNPVDLSHNIAQNVTVAEADNFLRCCRTASSIANNQRFFRATAVNEIWGLLHFVDSKRLQADGIVVSRESPVKSSNDADVHGRAANTAEKTNDTGESVNNKTQKQSRPQRKIPLPML